MEYGLQLYSIRDITKDDLDGALRQVSEMGYKFVEFAGFFGHSAQEVKAMLDKYGLKVSGTHTGWQEVAEHFEETVAYHKAIGNKNIIIPGCDLSTQEKLDEFVKMANEFQPKLAAEGIRFGYHNHAHEFAKDGDDVLMDVLMENTEKEIFAEFDVFWVAYAGYDPVEYIRRYAGRQPLMHLKELAADRRANVELGTGVLDFAAIIRAGQQAGTEHFIIEQEEYTLPPLESCKASLDAVLRL